MNEELKKMLDSINAKKQEVRIFARREKLKMRQPQRKN